MTHARYADDVKRQLLLLGERIKTARVRRRWSMDELAVRVGVGRRTIARLEDGSPGVALGLFLSVLQVMGLGDSVDGVARPELDKAGIFLEKRRQPKHVHREHKIDLDF
jgi:transcriptional regulator with XRE-family HTH domain